MAWTAPRTWTPGEIPTATNFNVHVRDNMLALRTRAIATGTFNNVTYAVMSWTAVVDDFGSSISTNFWTAPWAGRFTAVLQVTWSGATGTGSFGAKIDRKTAADALVENWAESTSDKINGAVNMTGAGVMLSGERLTMSAFNNATGTAGTLTARFVVTAAG